VGLGVRRGLLGGRLTGHDRRIRVAGTPAPSPSA